VLAHRQRCSGLVPDQATCERLISPGGGEGVGHDFPLSCRAMHAMVLPHTGTLTFIASRIPTGGRALFLLPIRLDYINLAVLLQTLRDESIKPCLWNFPKAPLLVPLRVRSSLVAYPGSVPRIKWQPHTKSVTRSPPQEDGDFLLIPDLPQPFGGAFIHAEPFVLSYALTNLMSVPRFSGPRRATPSTRRNRIPSSSCVGRCSATAI
jgi:hypothetical protein